MDLNLKDRAALVTGAGSGLGEAIARALAAEGCRVFVIDRDASAAARAASSIASGGFSTHAVTIDVADAAAVESAFAALRSEHGPPDILVNAAGLLSTGHVADLPADEFGRVARVNLEGVLHCVKAVIPAMKAAHYGRIINVASVSAMRGGGSVGNTLYGATKAGVVAMSMGLARELGPDGITVNAVSPAIVDTAMTHAALTAEARARIMARIPVGRFGLPSDVADLVVFLASDRSSFITGAVIPVDGGILTT
jgi:NAD(P)-dependent dehydrogenase (short-subunit alcohol dehydrogenase family)